MDADLVSPVAPGADLRKAGGFVNDERYQFIEELNAGLDAALLAGVDHVHQRWPFGFFAFLRIAVDDRDVARDGRVLIGVHSTSCERRKGNGRKKYGDSSRFVHEDDRIS